MVKQYNLTVKLSSITHVIVGCSRVAKQCGETYLKKYPCKVFKNACTITEVTALVMIRANCRDKDSIGKVVAGTQIKVIDVKTGHLLGTNKYGETYLRGPIKFNGYHENEEATKAILDAEERIHSADICCFNSDETSFIVDRIKDTIPWHGLDYSSVEVEDVLMQHQPANKAAVICVTVGTD